MGSYDKKLCMILPLKSIWFLVIYTFAGLTDVLDGWIARKTGSASEFGARLDSVSDLLFYGVILIRFFPVLSGVAVFLLPYLLFSSFRVANIIVDK